MLTQQRSGWAVALAVLAVYIQVALVAADGDVACSLQPPALPRNLDYLGKCDTAKPYPLYRKDLGPCFSHSAGSLEGADIFPSIKDEQAVDNNLVMAENADLRNFTPVDSSKPFSVRWNYAGISLHYEPLNSFWCYRLTVEKWANNGYKLRIAGGKDSRWETKADTETPGKSSEGCWQWLFVHLEKQ